MKKTLSFNTGAIFVLFVCCDVAVIHLFSHFTPLIVPLRLGFVFVVITGSVLAFYCIVKPDNPLETGVVLSAVCFIFALCESYGVHVMIERGRYQALYLLPSCFALVIPFVLSVVYKRYFWRSAKKEISGHR